MTDMTTARVDATHELATALVKAAAEVMTVHGDDPQGSVILVAGFVVALRQIGEHINPMVPHNVRELLR